MILSHFRSGSAAVFLTSKEYKRQLIEMIAELPKGTPVCTMVAPSGELKEVTIHNNRIVSLPVQGQQGLAAGYKWASDGPGRVLVVYNFHVIVNNPGAWQGIIEATDSLRTPKNSGIGDPASLVVFVAPCWELFSQNPLQGVVPILTLPLPTRDYLKGIADGLAPLNGGAEGVADALCGLTADAAEQAAAECLAANGGSWNTNHLRQSRRQVLLDHGLHVLPPIKWDAITGLSGWKRIIQERVIPFIRHPKLAIRCILDTGLPGLGKTYGARGLASALGTDCIELDLERSKASGGGFVGKAWAALNQQLDCLDSFGKEAPLIVLLDELEKVASEGLDAGTSSGMHSRLLRWLQNIKESSQILVIGTVNEGGKLSSALENRFQLKFWFDLPTQSEREGVAYYHYSQLGVAEDQISWAAESTAKRTEGFTSREIAEAVCPDVCAYSECVPTLEIIDRVCKGITPTSQVKAEDFNAMRKAASSYRRANDDPDVDLGATRKIMK